MSRYAPLLQKPLVQRTAVSSGAPAAAPPLSRRRAGKPPSHFNAAPAKMGTGEVLASHLRAKFEEQLGADLNTVRVHRDATADAQASSLNAKAFTIGNEVSFARDAYQPDTLEGQRLIAHELTHVRQQQRLGAQRVQLKGKNDVTVASQPCCTGDACAQPDHVGGPQESGNYLLSVHIDTEASSWHNALRTQRFGHTYVEFYEDNGTRYTYGFYPAGALPSENQRMVTGCVRHPDTTHAASTDETVTLWLSRQQYHAALAFAQQRCRTPPDYGQRYTCSTFAARVAAAAGQTLPSAKSEPTTIFYQEVPAIDNPNTLRERVQEERDNAHRGPIWNNECVTETELEFNRCLALGSNSMRCIAARQQQLARCQP